MKIPPAKVESFVKSPDANINFVLVYGPDIGLVSDRTTKLSKTIVEDLSDPFRVTDLPYDRIKDDPSVLADEINAMCFMGGRRLIKVRMESTTLPKDVCEIIEKSNGDSFVIFSAGDLTPASSLRKFFEKSGKTAALACYKDDNATISRVIGQKLLAEGYEFSADVTRYLSESFSGDRLVIMSEVEKLITYMGDKKQISLSDVEECIYDSSEFSLDELCIAVASRNLYDIEKNLNKAMKENVTPITIIRLMLRYFMRLQQVRNMLDDGAPEQQAMSSLRPPVFFKQAPLFKRHLSLWTSPAISKVITKLIELEIECKKTGSPAELLCSRLLIIIPLAVK